ncbi:MAG: DUF4062 domain-containing protein [Verrucomicrobia bacterium]|jgi:hypothetical protein|nr:DUF4062 domain-containing protein [Verrucomicrobiota bacterium]MBT7069176.1 DUF4062 domain-containing protein [Verrucomicrobiota bacterium]MBT7699610.1 DUF4062 domain-containing protein [Verrucomicrobiota bacterium]
MSTKLKILVSSVVYGYEDLLESIYSLLDEYQYDVLMSHKGTVPIDPELSAMTSCLEAVEKCDVFLGMILPRYGSGREEKDSLSITHREALRAIELNKPRWFLVHENVAIARHLLKPYRDPDHETTFRLKPGIEFQATPILEDLRILDLYEKAMNLDAAEVKHRRANWVQPFGPDDDARLFATAQFRRYRELAEKYLPRLKDTKAIRNRVKGGPA